MEQSKDIGIGIDVDVDIAFGCSGDFVSRLGNRPYGAGCGSLCGLIGYTKWEFKEGGRVPNFGGPYNKDPTI